MNKMRTIALLSSLVLYFCINAQQNTVEKKPVETMWIGKLRLNDSTLLYFDLGILNAKTGKQMIIHNGEESITITQVTETKDSLSFKMPVFDSEFKCKKAGDSISGSWINHMRKTNNVLPFSATKTSKNSETSETHSSIIKTKWEMTFNPSTTDEYKGIGLVEHGNKAGDRVEGTILTETGDYRYLAGSFLDDQTLYFSCFDGAHAFMFKAKLKPDTTLEGDFWSGSHGHEKWKAKLNDRFELRNPDSLTFLKPGFDKFEFSFPDLTGKKVSITDPKYKGKVVIVQIMGSWCPNCMDETKFLAGFYDKQKAKGLEVVALAYERTGDIPKAVTNVQRVKKKFNCNYDVLIASTSSEKDVAAKTLPMLNHIMSYPTTIFIDKKGKVRKIHTGFNGPATGKYYDEFVEEINKFVEKLIKEK